uniref:Uncharacterized protein n=1 Tax=Podoviridae sp. ctU7u6 TaxID=2825252 RepID=A0A8S5P813_9CAUD|nr:MAG TPA: hypothetical protein [Podoviridae sp. ctU7u6]
MHFTPKTYIARSIFNLSCVIYKKLVPSMSWEVIEFFMVLTRITQLEPSLKPKLIGRLCLENLNHN